VIDGFLSKEEVQAINREWPEESWTKEEGRFNRKWSTPLLPPAAKAVAGSIDVSLVEELTGIPRS
jgi:hypothetical protein